MASGASVVIVTAPLTWWVAGANFTTKEQPWAVRGRRTPEMQGPVCMKNKMYCLHDEQDMFA